MIVILSDNLDKIVTNINIMKKGKNMFRRLSIFVFGLSVSLTAGLTVLEAQQPAAPNAAPAVSQDLSLDALGPLDKKEAKPLDMSLFKVPEKATPAELIKFLDELEKKLPQPKSEAEMHQLIDAMSKTFIEVSDKILAAKDLKPEEKKQAYQYKMIALTAKSGIDPTNKAAAEELGKFVDSVLKDAKTTEEKIDAWKMKLQSVIGLGGNDAAGFDKAEAVAAEILKNKEDELQILGLEVKAQLALTKGEKEAAAFDQLVSFLEGYLKQAGLSKRCSEKAREIKFLGLTLAAQKSPEKEAALEAYFEELIKSDLSADSRKGIYQLRLQPLMGGAQGPQGQPKAPSPEADKKILKVAEYLLAEKTPELQSLGITTKAGVLSRAAQSDPAKVADLFKFVDEHLAKNPADAQKTQLYGVKIQGYLLKSQMDEKAMDDLAKFVDEAFAKDKLPILANCKIRLLMFKVSKGTAKIDDLNKVFDEFSKNSAFKDIVNSVAPEVCVLRIKNVSENKGKIEDLNAVLSDIKKMMESEPEAGTVVVASRPEIEMIGSNNNDANLYSKVLKDFAAFCAASSNEGVKAEANFFKGQISLIELPGSSFTLEGVVADGSDFSSKKLAGKVYLVDLWSMQDQSYFGSVETLKGLYDGYKNKGFEIVSVNLDNDTRYLKQIIEMLGINWPLVSKKMTADAGKKFPEIIDAAGSGSKFLVGKDGKVLMVARDLEEVKAKLLSLLGEPEKPAPKADDKKAEKPAPEKPAKAEDKK